MFHKAIAIVLLLSILFGLAFVALSAASSIFFDNPFYWIPLAAVIFFAWLIWDWAKFKVEMQMHDEEHTLKILSKKHEQ